MELKDILSVSGMPGLYRLISSRNNGIVVEDLSTGKRGFVSLRKHQFTPLESVGIYTYTDVVELADVFGNMHNSGATVPESAADASELHDFFRSVVADFDEDRVRLTDIRKVIKWYSILKDNGVVDAQKGASDEEE